MAGKKQVFALDAHWVGATAMIIAAWAAFSFAHIYYNWVLWLTIPFTITVSLSVGMLATVLILYFQTAPGNNQGERNHRRRRRHEI